MEDNKVLQESIQEKAHKRLHAVFKNDRKKMFPFLKIALESPARSTKVLLELDDAAAKQFLALLNFFVKELDDSYKFGEVVGEMHRHFLWSKANKEDLRILFFMRRGFGAGDIARKMEVAPSWVSQIQYRMLAEGAALGKFTHIEAMTSEYVSGDADIRKLLSGAYDENFERFAAKVSYKRKNLDRGHCLHLAAYYAREMVAKTLFGGNFEQTELAL